MRRIALWMAVMLAIPFFSLLGGSPAISASSDCHQTPYIAVDGTTTGNSTAGSWTKGYNPYCDDSTQGTITVTWNTWIYNGYRYVNYDMTVEAKKIRGNDCIQVAFDWNGHMNTRDHEDNQIMRNCLENSTRTMDTQVINLDKYYYSLGFYSTDTWTINRMQISTYDPDGGTVFEKICPGDVAPATNALSECTAWNPNGDFDTKAAKIRRTTNSGTWEQNTPTWPDNYDVLDLTTANA